MRTRPRYARQPRAAALLGTEEARLRPYATRLAITTEAFNQIENLGSRSRAEGGGLSGRICYAEQRSRPRVPRAARSGAHV
jgi:hypothetical protein